MFLKGKIKIRQKCLAREQNDELTSNLAADYKTPAVFLMQQVIKFFILKAWLKKLDMMTEMVKSPNFLDKFQDFLQCQVKLDTD